MRLDFTKTYESMNLKFLQSYESMSLKNPTNLILFLVNYSLCIDVKNPMSLRIIVQN